MGQPWALYNEIDPYAADWLENLIAAGHIAPGIVDRRSIVDVEADGLHEFTQIHWFAGIGGWSLALRRAGYADDRPIWTASLPCQPFSAAGQQKAMKDDRHLWPVFYDLVRKCRPPICVGEQVSSKPALAWWDVVSNDFQTSGYAVAAADTSVAQYGGPHIRQRLYWLAHAVSSDIRSEGFEPLEGTAGGMQGSSEQWERIRSDDRAGGAAASWLAHTDESRPQGRSALPECADQRAAGSDGVAERLDNPASPRHVRAIQDAEGNPWNETRLRVPDARCGDGRPNPLHGPWRDADWLFCTDSKWRPVEPGSSPLASSLPRGMGTLSAGVGQLVDLAGCDARSLRAAKRYRVGSLKGYGNAICIQQAEGWMRAVMSVVL